MTEREELLDLARRVGNLEAFVYGACGLLVVLTAWAALS